MNRQRVFHALVDSSSACGHQTVTVNGLARELDTDEAEVCAHLDALIQCELAVAVGKDEFRITLTGEELHGLGLDESVVIDDCE